MTASGWLTMTVVVGFMTSLLGWSVWKVLSTPNAREHIHPAIELDTPDMHTDTNRSCTPYPKQPY